MSRQRWVTMVTEAAPIITDAAAELLYFRVVAAWGTEQKFFIADGTGGSVDLTKLYEQYTIIQSLTANYK